MKLRSLIKDIRKMSESELLEHIRQVRHSKYVVKPASVDRAAKPKRQAANRATTQLSKLLKGMSEIERAKLINALEGK